MQLVPLWSFLAGVEPGGSAREGKGGGPGEPPRLRDPESVVLDHLSAHGRVTRKEVAQLCGLTASQASRLLRRLVAEDEISRHGAGRGTWYGRRPGSRTPTD